ncbi:MAG: hypothetical protein DRJ42_25585 [Deltaproteobacteria bacterium]|nr:MAG: hypothetical protein DRJ42_25585 [Deltaproteobacteria bacterium]
MSAVVAPEVIEDAIEVGELLSRLAIPHALVGGLAVGLNGFPRSTKDVDYLVGPEAFETTSPLLVYRPELKDRIEMGVVDLLAVPDAFPCLAGQLAIPNPGEVHVIAPEALVLMKLSANRPQDRADVTRLLGGGLDEGTVAAYLAEYAPGLLNRFAELLGGTPT